MSVRFFECGICSKQFPLSLSHEHHKTPRSLGGSDHPSNLILLDHSCHNNLHLIAYMMINPKRRQEAEPTAISIFPLDAKARRLLLEFSGLVAKEMALKKEIRKNPTDESRVTLELSQAHLELLRLWGRDNPNPNGKPRGVANSIRQILTAALVKAYPLKKHALENLSPLQEIQTLPQVESITEVEAIGDETSITINGSWEDVQVEDSPEFQTQNL